MGAKIKLSDENGGGCQPARETDSEGKSYMVCRYGTYRIKVTLRNFEEYTEEDYEVNHRSQSKKIELTLSGSGSVAIVGRLRYTVPVNSEAR